MIAAVSEKRPRVRQRKNPGSLRRPGRVVVGGEFAVGAGAADFHTFAAELVKTEGCAPAIAKFTALVERRVVFWHEGEAEAIGAGEGGGDIRVFADRISFAREVAPPGVKELLQNIEVARDGGVGRVEPGRDRKFGGNERCGGRCGRA